MRQHWAIRFARPNRPRMTPDSVAGFRLSPVQRRLWQLGATTPAFRVQCTLSVPPRVDVGELRDALAQAVAREPIFRTRLQQVAGLTTPIQVVGDNGSLLWEEDKESGTADAGQWGQQGRGASDGTVTPVVRARFAGKAAGGGTLTISVPSLFADVATLQTLVTRIADSERTTSPAYVQFAEWQNQCAEGGASVAAIREWSTLASAARETAGLPDEKLAPTGEFAPRFLATTLPPEIAQRLSDVAQQWRVGPESIVLACWHHVLGTLTQSEAVVVGVVFTGREHAAVAHVCGPIAQPIPQRLTAAPDDRFVDLIRRVDDDLHMQRQCGLYYTTDRAIPFSCTFAWESWPEHVRWGNTSLELRERFVCTEPFGLQLTCIRQGERLTLELGYDGSRFTSETTAEIGELVSTLLTGVLEDGNRRTSIDFLGPTVRSRVLQQSRGAATPIADGSIVDAFADQVSAHPDRAAVVDRQRTLSYRELDAASSAVAVALRHIGAGPDVLIGLVADRSVDTIVGLLGILKAGAAYVPLDAGQPVEHWRAAAAHARIRALVGPAALLPANDYGTAVLRLPLDSGVDNQREKPDLKPLDHHLAYAIFTSGSTGRPKAVAIEHRSVLNLRTALAGTVYEAFAGPLRVAVNAPLTFDASVKQWIQLLQGHTVCPVPQDVRYDPSAMIGWLEETRIDVVDCTPAQLRPLLAAGLSDRALPDLKAVLIGGEAIDAPLWTALRDSRIRFYNVYGPTECTVDATVCDVRTADTPTIGQPLDNVETYVVNERCDLVPIGVDGELLIGGAGVARGYMNMPAVTAERFVPHPFSTTPGARLYRTGDRVRWLRSGHLEFRGRLDRQVKIRGHRIEPGEIEASLADYDGVDAAVVVTETVADGQPRLVAYLAASSRVRLDESDLRSWLRGRLPEFMLPERIARVERFPLTANGKIDHGALRQEAQALQRRPMAAPRSELERTISEVWRDVLQVESVSIDDNFFDAGGHSLLLVQLYSRLRERLGREFPMVELFRRPTISAFASFLTDAPETTWSSAAIAARADRQREAYRQERIARSKAP